MDIKKYEESIRKSIEDVVIAIILNNKTLNISTKSRAGAEVSDFLEEKFVLYTKDNKNLLNSEKAPKGKTKNPWDARTFYKLNKHKEEIWIDFKAFKLAGNDSNPDIGTPDKIFKFIKQGGFYLLYVHVYYRESTDGGLEFIKHNNNYVKSYFLKDVNSSFRRTPTNQLQVNIDAEPEYRSREDFIKLLNKKILEGIKRQVNKSILRQENIIKEEKELIKQNEILEKAIEENFL